MPPPETCVGYVLQMYPPFPETFILHEVLAQDEQGADLCSVSLGSPVDRRFHEAPAEVRAPVTYLPDHVPKLLAADADEAVAAAELACAVRAHGVTHTHAHFGEGLGYTGQGGALVPARDGMPAPVAKLTGQDFSASTDGGTTVELGVP